MKEKQKTSTDPFLKGRNFVHGTINTQINGFKFT